MQEEFQNRTHNSRAQSLPELLVNQWRITLVIAIIFICISFAFSFLVIKDFSGPLSGRTGLGPWAGINHDPVDILEYPGFYFAENLHFNPFPQLNLVNNQVFYPYGTNNVFNAWIIEGDIFYAILFWFFGLGAWFQIYFLTTVLITAGGAFLLLLRDYGLYRALGVSLFVSFGNFYAINKYPHHLNLSIFHWTVLSLIVDFLIVKRVVLKKHVSLRLLLIRSCLLLLTVGQDIGYIAGFGLMSFTVSIVFITLLIYYRYFRGDFRVLIELIYREKKAYEIDFFAYPRTCLFLLGVNLTVGYLYLPLVTQIAGAAKSFDFTGFNIHSFWTNPFRLLIPYIPGINTPNITFENVFNDSPEAIGAGSPGWFLMITGTMGLWQNRKQIAIFIPLLLMFLLCLFYLPQSLFKTENIYYLIILLLELLVLWIVRKKKRIFVPLLLLFLIVFFINPSVFLLPTLKIFPWFTFNRVAGRCTVIYPVILGIFALYFNLDWLTLPKRRLLAGFLVILACIEFGTAYSFRLDYQQPTPLDKDFLAYMNFVKKQPGEAVLDWPFCILEGGTINNICPLSGRGTSAMRRFHEKKVMGHYFGRLHASQIQPFLQAGWKNLFLPDRTYSHQRRCFNEKEWSFFTDFYKLNDFAGINLYVEKIPQKCLNEFFTRFGNPVAQTVVPGAGKVKFIPKSSELRSQVNLASGVNLKFIPSEYLDLSDSDLLQVNEPHGLTITGLSEIMNDDQDFFRQGYDPEILLSFKLSKPQDLELSFSFDTLVDLDDVSININEFPVTIFPNLKEDSSIKKKIKFQGTEGVNNIRFKSKRHKNANNPDEKEVIEFDELSILPVKKALSRNPSPELGRGEK